MLDEVPFLIMPSDETIVALLGRNIRIARERAQLTQDDLAALLGVTKSAISQWEAGRIRPSSRNFKLLHHHLHTENLEAQTLSFTDGRHIPEYEYFSDMELVTLSRFEQLLFSHLDTVESHVYYSRLCNSLDVKDVDGRHPRLYRPYELRHQNFSERVRNKISKFLRVEVFLTKERFVDALQTSREYLGTGYWCRFYFQPPDSTPAINIRSLDDRVIMLGGYHTRRTLNLEESVLVVNPARQPISSFLLEYWHTLWEGGRDLWDYELAAAEKLALSLGYSEAEWYALKKHVQSGSTRLSEARL